MKKLMLLAVVCSVLGLTGSNALATRDLNAGRQEVGEDLLAICRSVRSVNTSSGSDASRAPDAVSTTIGESTDSVISNISAR